MPYFRPDDLFSVCRQLLNQQNDSYIIFDEEKEVGLLTCQEIREIKTSNVFESISELIKFLDHTTEGIVSDNRRRKISFHDGKKNRISWKELMNQLFLEYNAITIDETDEYKVSDEEPIPTAAYALLANVESYLKENGHTDSDELFDKLWELRETNNFMY